jgi:hypothetical protein
LLVCGLRISDYPPLGGAYSSQAPSILPAPADQAHLPAGHTTNGLITVAIFCLISTLLQTNGVCEGP